VEFEESNGGSRAAKLIEQRRQNSRISGRYERFTAMNRNYARYFSEARPARAMRSSNASAARHLASRIECIAVI